MIRNCSSKPRKRFLFIFTDQELLVTTLQAKNPLDVQNIPYRSISNITLKSLSGCSSTSEFLCVFSRQIGVGKRYFTSSSSIKTLIGGDDLDQLRSLLTFLTLEYKKNYPHSDLFKDSFKQNRSFSSSMFFLKHDISLSSSNYAPENPVFSFTNRRQFSK
jgi:hypothetical protein